MSITRSIAEKLDGFSDVPLQATSLEIWQQKYCLRDREGQPVDTVETVARYENLDVVAAGVRCRRDQEGQ